MSFGHSGAIRFDVNKNSAGPGIFWQSEKPKAEQRKFGYKSKGLRHAVRKPDNNHLIEEMRIAHEEEKKKFNKTNTDYIQKNRHRYQQKSENKSHPDGSSHIGPGTVTLTQDQLAALLASLGGLRNAGDKDNPLKISIDASTNKIEVEKYESDGGSDDDVEINGHDKDDDGGGGMGVGIYDLLDSGDIMKKPTKSKKKPRDTDLRLSRDKDSKGDFHVNRASGDYQNEAGPDTARSTLDTTKKEAKVDHLNPTVPRKHMTVGERKRMQWALERAELPQEYDPWGRPGAGAPAGKTESSQSPVRDNDNSQNQNGRDRQEGQTGSQHKATRQRQQEELQNEIEKLQKEIREAEQKKQIREKKKQSETEEKSNTKQRSRKENKERRSEEDGKDNNNSRNNKKRTNRDTSESRRAAGEGEEKKNGDQVQIIIINKKKDNRKEKEDDREKKVEDDVDTQPDKGDTDEFSQITAKARESEQNSEAATKDKGSSPGGHPQNAKKKGLHFGDEEQLSHLSKKEIERRKWLAELDKQREEQRMKKQQEKERDRAELQDQWADRFVYHKSPQDVTPRYGQSKPSSRQQGSVLGAAAMEAVEDTPLTYAPPAAMRSSMVIGAGTLNENRFDNRKAEEKRQWLEELEKQREEQRRAKVEKKERERREEDDGMWADRYQTDRQKLTQFAGASSQGPPMSDNPKVSERHQRVGSAPAEQPATVRASQEEPTTFIRGQGVSVDPVTRKEQEEKRRVHLEYQAEVKAQIEEKERLKREERERKIREDLEEEKKFRMERDRQTRQEESEQKKTLEREALRQRQMDTLKNAMNEAQEKAQEEKNVRRMQQLQQRGHDVSQLKATYEEPVSRMSGHGSLQLPLKGDQPQATTPRIKEYEISNIPGLGNAPSPPPHHQAPQYGSRIPDQMSAIMQQEGHASHSNHDHQAAPRVRHPMGQSYTKEPYVEDRVLTPSRFRNPSKARDDLDSPRREFGTQTLELKDLQAILNSLPDDIQIEYKTRVEEALREKERSKPVPSRKVHSKSAEDAGRVRKTVPRKEAPKDKEKPVGKEKPPRPNERPAWNQTKRKTAVKNSERDPFYQQRKEEAEARKVKRERQLQYLQELNKERIPSLSPTRARANSPADERRGRNAVERGRRPADAANRAGKKGGERGESPNVLSLLNGGHRSNRTDRSKSPALGTRRSSPPVPSVKHRTVARREVEDENNPYSYTNSVLRTSQGGDTRYEDASVATAPVHDGDFIPFTRTTEILDPAQADEPMAISRENSRMERARRAYHETRHPANKGRKLNVFQDREREATLKAAQDPILNPQLVTDHPTARQDMILQQLSSLRQNLMEKRKELENYMTPSELEMDHGASVKT